MCEITEKLHIQELQIQKVSTNQEHFKESLGEISTDIKEVLCLARATNGRVTELEKVNIRKEAIGKKVIAQVQEIEDLTVVPRWIHKYPKVTGVLGLFGYSLAFKEIRDFYFATVEEFWLKIF